MAVSKSSTSAKIVALSVSRFRRRWSALVAAVRFWRDMSQRGVCESEKQGWRLVYGVRTCSNSTGKREVDDKGNGKACGLKTYLWDEPDQTGDEGRCDKEQGEQDPPGPVSLDV